MKKLMRCKGCFTEWNDLDFQCFWCGWSPDMEGDLRDRAHGWSLGKVLENRYLLGRIYVKTDDGYTVWRVYDRCLDVTCFFLVAVNENIHWLSKIAWGFLGQPACGIQVLGLREIEGKYALVFSMKDAYMEIEKFRNLIQVRETDPMPQVGNVHCKIREELQKNVLPEGVLLSNRYQTAGCLGIGGFGILYLCEDILLQRNVTVKEYFPEAWAEREGTDVSIRSSKMLEAYRFGLQSFLGEAKITAKFIHTNHIVTIYDVFQENDTAYLVTEYLPGTSIAKEFRRWNYEPYSPREMAEILGPVLEALEEVHKCKIIHSDLSPGNIMRTKEGEIVLIDFGAAKYNVGENQPAVQAAFLKTAYAAPEQYRTAKEGRVADEGAWTDVYAAGAVMYYLLTGHKAPDALSREAKASADLISPKKYNKKLKRGWIKLIHRCTEPDIQKRISSCRVLKEEMEHLLKHEKEER